MRSAERGRMHVRVRFALSAFAATMMQLEENALRLSNGLCMELRSNGSRIRY